MTVNRGGIFLLVLAIGCRIYTVAGFECLVAKEPISFTGDSTYSVNFMWDCLLLSNESLLSIMWLKEDMCMAKATDGVFTPCDSYMGRVEIFGTFGISLHNISRNDSGHYNTVILLNGILHDYLPCQSIYLPVLPEKRSGFNEGTAQLFAIGENYSHCDQQGPSKLEIGLICGFLPVTILGLVQVLCYLKTQRQSDDK